MSPLDGDLAYQLDRVTKVYGTRTVLQVDRLEVSRGEILAILGPSGAGKTTLLRLMALVDEPSRGTLRYFGRDASGLASPIELRRRLAMVFQRPALLTRSVRANLMYGIRLRNDRTTTDEVDSILKELGLDAFKRQIATTLSGGERQRVALARALALETDVLLLDEPTAHLDPGNVALVENRLLARVHDQRHTMVIATHNIFQAKRLATRVALLLDGRLIEVGITNTFFNSPTDPRTAAFLRGEMVY